ncbi:GMC family oxidoreductase [Aliiglaciecola sp. 3_MG-2023]|uniref:GMC oxidoreductase n=1 Tax=Aliiglaciecola sp. 3_MG-2023 TaxID=3062644 RepID=UPI0026E2A290|nr:GMC family oxidoreductase [Aliiglaciecola sp. 3_MG-2023]MDO6693293.1 GMC family oxidoreductase [Aliiglaciecola sp. 3_MG-2023]
MNQYNQTKTNDEYDVIVVGSGITGGWAAKEFCEKGYKTLVIERGRHLDHPSSEYNDMKAPWQLDNMGLAPEELTEQGRYSQLRAKKGVLKSDSIQFFVDDKEFPYSHPKERPFMWTRGYQLGGRSITWGRQVLRWGAKDFAANAKDGHGVAWPIGYEDLAPWYDYVESYIGVSANKDGLDVLPDGVFQTPWEMSSAEKHIAKKWAEHYSDRHLIIGRSANLTEPSALQTGLGRGKCQARSYCQRGCTFGAYFSSLSATLPSAKKTGNLTVVTDAIASTVDYDEQTGKASGITVIDAKTKKQRSYKARVVFLCASALASVQIMLNSKSKTFPNGIANSSGAVGHYIMDHFMGVFAKADVLGLEDKYSYGRRPIATYVPNYRHEKTEDVDFIRGYGFQATAGSRPNSGTTAKSVGIGAQAKNAAKQAKPWQFKALMYGETLPYFDNKASLHPTKTDQWGIPQLHIDAKIGENERKMIKQAAADIEEMLKVAGCSNIKISQADLEKHFTLGKRTHEMGGACMGSNPATSVLNKWAQSHDVENLFVTDGACMSSCATQNPSLTYMAITARAADYAAKLMRTGKL